MSRVLSGVRPTGDLHLGNYLGAIRNWVRMQDQIDENFFCIVDLHALTTLAETSGLAQNTRTVAAAYMASGIDPQKSAIFAQSHVAEHSELMWILGCLTPLGWLKRMTQFKDKAGKNQDQALLGLFAYPVLMAADILIYKATHVPVGEDQKQHLELARDLAGLFNRTYDKSCFPLPEPMIFGEATRVMSLRDGTSKMSKSDISEYSRIQLMDDADTLMLKIRKAKTDLDPLPETFEALKKRPEAENLVVIYAALSDQSPDDVCQFFAGQNFAPFKKSLTELVISKITPIGAEMHRLLKDPTELDRILAIGAGRAKEVASQTIKDVRQAIGMLGSVSK